MYLRQRRIGVYSSQNITNTGAGLHSQHDLMDQLPGMRTRYRYTGDPGLVDHPPGETGGLPVETGTT